MRMESDGNNRGNPRLVELFANAPQEPKPGGSPTVGAWPQLVKFFKVAGQPVPGPWPPHQQPRPDPTDDAGPVAVPEPPDPGPEIGQASDTESSDLP